MESNRMLVMCDEGKKLLEGGTPPAPSFECYLTKGEFVTMRAAMAKAESFDALMATIASIVGDEARNAMLGNTVAFMAIDAKTIPAGARLKPVDESDTPGVDMTHFDGAGMFRLDFKPGGEAGYFIGDEMAKRALLRMITTPPAPLVESLTNRLVRIKSLRGALETIAETYGKHDAELAKFIGQVLKKDELSKS